VSRDLLPEVRMNHGQRQTDRYRPSEAFLELGFKYVDVRKS